MKSKIIAAMWIIAVVCILLIPTKVEAALQANGNAGEVYNVNQWITGIRGMQGAGGALGLSDEINATDLTSTNKNLDIHMQKNTEYGAMVILSASNYGNSDHIADGGTTTGNATGVKININKEWVAAGISTTDAASMKNASPRYKNVYTSTYAEKVGDAVATVGGWHGATGNKWISSASNSARTVKHSVLIRSYSGSAFSYYGYGYDDPYDYAGLEDTESHRKDADYRKKWHSRAVVVVGTGV